jgi:hypothetical protein
MNVRSRVIDNCTVVKGVTFITIDNVDDYDRDTDPAEFDFYRYYFVEVEDNQGNRQKYISNKVTMELERKNLNRDTLPMNNDLKLGSIKNTEDIHGQTDVTFFFLLIGGRRLTYTLHNVKEIR